MLLQQPQFNVAAVCVQPYQLQTLQSSVFKEPCLQQSQYEAELVLSWWVSPNIWFISGLEMTLAAFGGFGETRGGERLIFIIQLMGQCYSAKRSGGNGASIDTQNTMGEQPGPLSTLPLDYALHLSNLELRDVPCDSVGCKFTIEGKFEAELPRLPRAKTMKWSDEHRLQLSMTEGELRSSYLVVSVRNQNEKEIATISFNLYQISTGPYHHYFPLLYSGKTHGRISLDARMSRLVELTLTPESVSVELLREHPGEAFNFSFKTFTEQDQQVETVSSYESETVLYNTKMTEAELKDLICRSPTLRSPSKKKALVQGRQLKWSQAEAIEREEGGLPTIRSRYAVSQLHNESFQFLLWRVEKIEEEEQCSFEYETELYAECYVSFNKLIVGDSSISESSHSQRTITIEEKLYNKGKHFGKVKMKCVVTIPKFTRQMVAYVRTENGIQLVYMHFEMEAKGEGPQCKEIAEISQLKESFDRSLTELNNSRNRSNYTALILKRNAIDALLKLIPVLEKWSKSRTYSYCNEKELEQGQSVLLDVGFLLFAYLEEEDQTLRENCWKALTALISRGEFDLARMTLSPQERVKVKNNQMCKKLKNKVQIHLRYQSFMYTALGVVLKCLNKKALLENEMTFAELFCAYSYFRIPEFRQKLLTILTREDDPKIEGLQEIEFRNIESSMVALLDWETNFYTPLQSLPRFQENCQELKTTLESNEWKARMAKRGVPFYSFLIHLVDYVERVYMVTQNIVWHYLPGYHQLVKALMCTMSLRPVLEYPDQLAEACGRVLANESLLNTFIHIILSKTNLYDSSSLLKAIEIIDYFFSIFRRQKRKLPSTFIYPTFYEASKTILEGEHCFAIAKFLLLIYNNYSVFGSAFRKNFVMYLLGKVFFKLFLSWASNIRIIFHNLLVYRISLQCTLLRTNSITEQANNCINDDIRVRYKKLMALLKSVQDIRQQETVSQLASNYEKQYYKRMRNKILDRKRKKRLQLGGRKVRINLEDIPQPRCERMKSDHLLTENPELHLENGVSCKFESEKKKRKTSFFELEPISESNFIRKLTSRRKSSTEVMDSEIPEIETRLLQYLETSLRDFRAMEEAFKGLEPTLQRDPEQVPGLSIKVPLDQGDIRPNYVDEW